MRVPEQAPMSCVDVAAFPTFWLPRRSPNLRVDSQPEFRPREPPQRCRTVGDSQEPFPSGPRTRGRYGKRRRTAQSVQLWDTNRQPALPNGRRPRRDHCQVRSRALRSLPILPLLQHPANSTASATAARLRRRFSQWSEHRTIGSLAQGPSPRHLASRDPTGLEWSSPLSRPAPATSSLVWCLLRREQPVDPVARKRGRPQHPCRALRYETKGHRPAELPPHRSCCLEAIPIPPRGIAIPAEVWRCSRAG